MGGSDIGDITSPTNVGSRSTRVDPKLFGKPSDFSGDRREWRHFEWVFRNWFGFLYDAVEEWLDQAANAPGELGIAERRTVQGVRIDDWDVVARVHESSGERLWNHGWIQEETFVVGKSDC